MAAYRRSVYAAVNIPSISPFLLLDPNSLRVSVSRALHGAFRIRLDFQMKEMAVDAVELQRHNLSDNLIDSRRRERNVIRVAVHERYVATIRCYKHGVAAQEHAAAICSLRPQHYCRAFEMSTSTVQCESLIQLMSFLIPVFDDWVGSLDPLLEVGMQIDRCVAKRMAQFDHAAKHVGVRQRKG